MLDKPLKYPNHYQPRRPVIDENGDALSFRTHISRPGSGYDVYDLRNIIAQVKLYRWVRSEFVNGTSIADLHGYLFWDQSTVAKRHLGATILQAVAYNPRKLKGETKDNPVACWTYVFFNPKDLEYGLEWMICIWLRRVVLADSKDELEEALIELAEAKDEELANLYWNPMTQPVVRSSIRRFDWPALWKEHELEVQCLRTSAKSRPELRSLF